MKKIFKSIGVCLIALVIAISPINTNMISAAEDKTAPQLISVEVLSNSVKAGNSFQVKVCIKESETGLARVTMQFNDSKFGMVAAYEEAKWETPVYSSGEKYIEYIFNIPTREDSVGGDWYIGIMELFDQKGNISAYISITGKNDNKLYSDSFNPQHVVSGKTHIDVTGGLATVSRPVINSVKIANPTVEKGQKLKIELDVTSTKPLESASVYMHSENWTDEVGLTIYDMPQGEGTKKVILEIPIEKERHLGIWEIQDIRFTDVSGNEAHYTNQLMDGYFADYYHEAPEKFDLLKFTITGVQGDEIAPVPNSIKVLNEELRVTKPGILYLQLDLTENGTGVSCIDLKYLPLVDSQESTGYIGWSRICLNAQDDGSDFDTLTALDKPLKTGVYILEVPIPSSVPNGQYRMEIELTDGTGNIFRQTTYDTIYADFFVEDEFDYKFEMGITNKDLLSAVKNLKEGEVGKILLGGNGSENVLSKEILDEIANQKKMLVCYRDGYQWIFDGKKIQPHKTKDINLTTRIYVVEGKYLSSGKQAIALSFANNGKLPGNIEFRFKSAFVRNYFGKEELLQLYHVQHPETGYEADIDYIQSGYARIPDNQAMFKIVLENGKDAWCSVNLNHNSKYVISDTEITKLSEKQAASLQSPPSNNTESPKPTAPEGNNTESPKPTAPEGNNTESPKPTAPEGNNTESPKPTAPEGNNTESPKPTVPEEKNNVVVESVIIILVCILVVGVVLAFALPKSRDRIKAFFLRRKLK